MPLIYLINPSNDPKYKPGIAYNACFPPLGIISLGTTVRSNCEGWQVKVFDGQVTPEHSIVRKIRREKPNVVGISVLAMTYRNALTIARVAKESGAITIFGNDQPAITGRQMLERRREIDYICGADVGEQPLVDFLDYLDGRRRLVDVPQLMYRRKGGIVSNVEEDMTLLDNRYTALDAITIPDRSLQSESVRQRYLESYLQSHPDDISATGITTINRFRGCARVKSPCYYCGIQDLTIRASSPAIFWEDVVAAHESGNNRLFEAGDSVSSVPSYLKRVLAEKPEGVRWNAMVYTAARETNVELISLYRSLGVLRANMGLDSGDETMLRRLKGAKDSLRSNKNAVKLLKSARIPVYASFVLGGPGETAESLENTRLFSRWLIENELVDGIGAHPLFPELNARSGRLLLHPAEALRYAEEEGFLINDRDLLFSQPEKWAQHENPDPDEISRDWIRVFCGVRHEDVLEAAEDIQAYARLHGTATGSFFHRTHG